MKRAVWAPEAEKELDRLDRATRERIVKAGRRLAETGHGDVRRVHERPGELALRVGDWRVFFVELTEQVDGGDVKILRFLRVRSRGHAYGR